MKKLLGLFLALTLLLSSAAWAGETVNTQGLPIVPEKQSFSISVLKRPVCKNNFSEKECCITTEAETNVHIEWNEIADSGWNEKVNIMFASEDLTDAYLGGVDVVANQEALTPIRDLLAQYAPGFSAYLEQTPELKTALTLPDGNICSLPIGNIGTWMDIGDIFYLNQDWLNALGLAMPETTEDFYAVLKAFKENDLNGNGDANDEIPFSFVGSRDLYPLFGAFGVLENANHVEVSNDTVSFTATKPGYRAALEYFHRLYTEALIDIEGFSQTQDQLVAKGKSVPQVLGGFCEWSDINAVGNDNYPSYAYLPVLEGPEGSRLFPRNAMGYGNLSGFVITKACENPEVLVRWYDYLNSSFEIRTLWGFGPENTTWKFLDNGLWTSTMEFLPEGMTLSEYRHTISCGSLAPVLCIDEVEGVKYFDYSITLRLDAIALYEPYFPEQVMPIGFDALAVKEERDILSVDINSYLTNFVATSIINGLTEAQWEEHLQKCQTLRTDEYTRLWQQTYELRK